MFSLKLILPLMAFTGIALAKTRFETEGAHVIRGWTDDKNDQITTTKTLSIETAIGKEKDSFRSKECIITNATTTSNSDGKAQTPETTDSEELIYVNSTYDEATSHPYSEKYEETGTMKSNSISLNNQTRTYYDKVDVSKLIVNGDLNYTTNPRTLISTSYSEFHSIQNTSGSGKRTGSRVYEIYDTQTNTTSDSNNTDSSQYEYFEDNQGTTDDVYKQAMKSSSSQGSGTGRDTSSTEENDDMLEIRPMKNDCPLLTNENTKDLVNKAIPFFVVRTVTYDFSLSENNRTNSYKSKDSFPEEPVLYDDEIGGITKVAETEDDDDTSSSTTSSLYVEGWSNSTVQYLFPIGGSSKSIPANSLIAVSNETTGGLTLTDTDEINTSNGTHNIRNATTYEVSVNYSIIAEKVKGKDYSRVVSIVYNVTTYTESLEVSPLMYVYDMQVELKPVRTENTTTKNDTTHGEFGDKTCMVTTTIVTEVTARDQKDRSTKITSTIVTTKTVTEEFIKGEYDLLTAPGIIVNSASDVAFTADGKVPEFPCKDDWSPPTTAKP